MTTANASWPQFDAQAIQAPVRNRTAVGAARRSLKRYQTAVHITDLAVVTVSVAIALLARFGAAADNASFSVIGIETGYVVAAAVIAVVWGIALSAHRTRDLRIIGSGTIEYRRAMSATSMAFGLLAIGMLALKVDIARGFFILAFPIGLVLLLVERWMWRRWLVRERTAGRCTVATAVVGPRADVQRTLRSLVGQPGTGFAPVAAIVSDDEDTTELLVGTRSVPIIGTATNATEAIAAHEIDAVVVVGQPNGSGEFIRELSWGLERTEAELMIASRLVDVAGPRIHFRPVEGLPLMHVELPSYQGGKHVVKRFMDIVLAAAALLALWPLFVAIAVLIKIEDGGPAFFLQQRVGRSGELFTILKFRSMVLDAEARAQELIAQSGGSAVLFKMKDDPRVTRVGRWLRKTSLDELPQLWNILIGDMSIVGPRPQTPREVEQYERHYVRRLYIKPGLTGLWQVSGRSDLTREESSRLDLYYVENWSVAGDLQIIWRTAKVVVRGRGAY